MAHLDFLGIGAQKAGTTTLHLMLVRHDRLRLPPEKEVPFFTHPERWPRGWDWYRERFLPTREDEALVGKVTPHYMMGAPGLPTEQVARRVRETVPDVLLIALLRDPIQRAASQWRMNLRRGVETRPFATAMRDSLEPTALDAGRSHPEPTNTYVAQGEYGRVLRAWTSTFDRAQLHVELTAALSEDPEGVSRRVLAHLGLPYQDLGPPPWAQRGGDSVRVSPQAAVELRRLLRDHVFQDARAERAFDYWFEQWNVRPRRGSPDLTADLELRLRSHFREDAIGLAQLGIDVPWGPSSAEP